MRKGYINKMQGSDEKNSGKKNENFRNNVTNNMLKEIDTTMMEAR